MKWIWWGMILGKLNHYVSIRAENTVCTAKKPWTNKMHVSILELRVLGRKILVVHCIMTGWSLWSVHFVCRNLLVVVVILFIKLNSTPKAQGMLWKRRRKDYKSKMIWEFAVRLGLLVMYKARATKSHQHPSPNMS